jgi:hypothetical protein
MAPLVPSQLPKLQVGDFAPGQDHVAESYHNGKVFAILHKDDTARQILPNLTFAAGDPHTYVFVHGGEDVTRFENMQVGTHEIPTEVVAELLKTAYGSNLNGMSLRLCTCYGNLLRPGDVKTLVQGLADLLPQTMWAGYHGLVILDINPPQIRLGRSIQWDATLVPPGPVIVGPPGTWEPVTP